MAKSDFQEYTYDNANDFLDSLNIATDKPIAWLDRDAWEQPWIFRGHGDSSWTLTPSAWRNHAATKKRLNHVKAEYTTQVKGLIDEKNYKDKEVTLDLWLQDIAESILVERFYIQALEIGLDMPDIEPAFSDIEHLIRKQDIKDPSDLYVLGARDRDLVISFAQHHRIPTRFLDWSTDPLAAAYFAAESAIEEESSSLCVWAINRRKLETGNRPENPLAMRIYTPIPSRNMHFKHQKSVFLYPGQCTSYCLGSGEMHDSLDYQHIPFLRDKSVDMVKIKLINNGHAYRDVLKRLASLGITRASLMPTYDNVSEAIFQRLDSEAIMNN